MKHLRCIGGPRHGSVIELAEHTSDVLLINPRAPQAPRTRYTARAVNTADGPVNFLAPSEMTDIEAFRIALGPIDHFNRSWISVEEEQELRDRVATLEADLNRPETADFMRGVPLEATHQRQRWGSAHDAGKAPLDWFWLIGYLAQKAAAAAIAGDFEKAKHHTISTAAALANWHLQLSGADASMRPGIADPEQAA